MDPKKRTRKVAFCCPNHGVLQEPVEYFSANMGAKKLVDIPVMYCQACRKYYTPFTNLLALVNLQYKGQQVRASQGLVVKSIPREEVRVPYFVEIAEENKRKEQIRIEKAEKRKQYFDGLREISHDSIVLTNKLCYIQEKKCPHCRQKIHKEHVKIAQRRKFLCANIGHCSNCNRDYITPEQFYVLCEKAKIRIKGYYREPFVSPVNIDCEFQDDNKYFFIPQWAVDFKKFDQNHLPPHGDDFYNMTDEEYVWVKTLYQPEEFPVTLRQKSFLGEAGYSTSESETRRRDILARCVAKYGKNKVVNQLRVNMDLRLKQKNGAARYERALNIWRGDIWYVEKRL